MLRAFAVARDDSYSVDARRPDPASAPTPTAGSVDLQPGRRPQQGHLGAGVRAREARRASGCTPARPSPPIEPGGVDVVPGAPRTCSGWAATPSGPRTWSACCGRSHDRRNDFQHGTNPAGTDCLRVLLVALTQVTATYPGLRRRRATPSGSPTPGAELLALVVDDDRPGTLAHSVRRLLDAAHAVRDQLSSDTWLVIGSLDREHPRPATSAPTARWRCRPRSAASCRACSPWPAWPPRAWCATRAGGSWTPAGASSGRSSSPRCCGPPSPSSATPPTDSLLLESVLTAAESIITYRRRYRSQAQLETVLDLLLLDADNPRSLAYQLDRLGGRRRRAARAPPRRPGSTSPSSGCVLEAADRAARSPTPTALGRPSTPTAPGPTLDALPRPASSSWLCTRPPTPSTPTTSPTSLPAASRCESARGRRDLPGRRTAPSTATSRDGVVELRRAPPAAPRRCRGQACRSIAVAHRARAPTTTASASTSSATAPPTSPILEPHTQLDGHAHERGRGRRPPGRAAAARRPAVGGGARPPARRPDRRASRRPRVPARLAAGRGLAGAARRTPRRRSPPAGRSSSASPTSRRASTRLRLRAGRRRRSPPRSTRCSSGAQGVCQDFAHLAIGCLRSLGPRRPLRQRLPRDRCRRRARPRLVGADVSHAWASVFVPGAGWVDVDPTNDQFVADRYVTTAWGRDYGDVPPLKGVIFTEGDRARADGHRRRGSARRSAGEVSGDACLHLPRCGQLVPFETMACLTCGTALGVPRRGRRDRGQPTATGPGAPTRTGPPATGCRSEADALCRSLPA